MWASCGAFNQDAILSIVGFSSKHLYCVAFLFGFAEREFDPAKHFDTHPDLVDQKFNRPTRKMLQQTAAKAHLNEDTIVIRPNNNTIYISRVNHISHSLA